MGESFGQIGLDLVVNQNQFNKQMQGIGGLAKKAGAALAGAFAVKKLADFGADCLKLGSDLQEVQNVVDVTFPSMNKQVNEFARNAAMQFGLSETMAKKFTGTFGAMAKSFGFSEKEALEMGTTLTGLSGDVASFYNMSQDEAYIKLKSVFTGETESLKDLGVVMSQSALDAYALSNGYGKVTAKMTEGEKVALRYKFVQEQLTLAAGDFARTSGSWANQMKILTLQFDSFKAAIGQGLINLFTPVIRVINTLLGKLITLANAFKAFTELITGKKAGDAAAGTKAVAGAAGSAAEGYDSAAGAADNLAGAAGGAGKAAKKAAKEMKALMGFDQINRMDEPADSGGSGGGGGGGAAMDFGSTAEGETIVDKLDKKLEALINRFKELAGLFAKGFKIGVGDLSVIDEIKVSLCGIGKSISEIFTDSDVVAAANRFLDTLAVSMGKNLGSFVSVGLTIADNVLGGINKYLEGSKERIKKFFIDAFDTSGSIIKIGADFGVALADIFTIFRSDTAKQITADIIAIYANGFMGVITLALKFGRDVLDAITGPFVDNKDKIKEAIGGTLEAVKPVIEGLRDIVTNTFDKISQTYDGHIAPMLQAFKEGLADIFGTFLDAYNEHVAPMLQTLGGKFKEVMEGQIQPAIDKIMDYFGSFVDLIGAFWTNVLSPLIQWIVKTIIPVVVPIIQRIYDTIMSVVGGITEAFGGIMQVLSGLIQFITGIFTGDWETCWAGIQGIFDGFCSILTGLVTGLWEGIKGIFSLALETITGIFLLAWETIISIVTTAIDAVKSVVKTGWELAGKIVKTVGDAIKGFVSTCWNAISATVSNVTNKIKTTVSNVFNGIKTTINDIMTGIKTGISTAVTAIKDKFVGTFTAMKTAVTGIFKGIWTSIKGVINTILGGIEGMANGVVKGINKVISALNGVSFDIPDWMGGGSFGFDIPTLSEVAIPRLAQGGYVKRNTPQLAMIGDNRHQGEVVAPENKLMEMATQAAQAASRDMVAALERVLGSQGGKTDLTVNVSITEKTLASAMLGLTGRHNRMDGVLDLKV